MVCELIFCSKLPDIPEKSQRGKKTNSKAIVKLYSLQASPKSSHRRCSLKKVLLKISQNSQQSTSAAVVFNNVVGLACWFIKNKTSTQVLSYEFCNIFKNNFFIELFRVSIFEVSKHCL